MVYKSVFKSVYSPSSFSIGGYQSSGGAAPSYDTDTQTYITAVEAADGQSLETGVKDAINAFVVGCKADGIWTAIKASCILAGARTLTGALVPLVGTAPTNNNFVSGDYSRTAGLTGDGSTKYLDSNRANDADPQDSKHIAVYRSVSATGGATRTDIGSASLTGSSALIWNGSTRRFYRANNNTGFYDDAGDTNPTGLWAVSRTGASALVGRINSTNISLSDASQTPSAVKLDVFRRGNTGTYSDATIAFYSIGESLDLALLDTRVTNLIADIGTALA